MTECTSSYNSLGNGLSVGADRSLFVLSCRRRDEMVPSSRNHAYVSCRDQRALIAPCSLLSFPRQSTSGPSAASLPRCSRASPSSPDETTTINSPSSSTSSVRRRSMSSTPLAREGRETTSGPSYSSPSSFSSSALGVEGTRLSKITA
jgi:hypothetical protein